MTSIQIPAEVAQAAESLGIDLEKLLEKELTPEHIQQLSQVLGVDLATLAGEPQSQPLAAGEVTAEELVTPQQPAQHPASAAAAAITGGVPGLAAPSELPPLPSQSNIPAQSVEGVTAQEGGETPEQQAQRELAVARQELQQTRSNLQSLQEARVVGSGGMSGPVDNAPPTLAQIEPGIRYAVRNGLISPSDLKEKFGDTIVQLFEADQGGAI